jgi:hypothetical protein
MVPVRAGAEALQSLYVNLSATEIHDYMGLTCEDMIEAAVPLA